MSFTRCSRNENPGTSDVTGSTSTDANSVSEFGDATSDPVSEPDDDIQEVLPDLSNLVHYDGIVQDSMWTALTVYPPFDEVQRLAWSVIQSKDSLAEEGFSPEDSAIFRPHEIKAHRAVLDYQRTMRSPQRLASFPGLFALTRDAEVTDSGSTFLPRPEPSTFFDKKRSFFIGGAPFINKLSPEDGATFTGPDGNPELRFESTHTENGNIIFNFLAYTNSAASNVILGPPLNSDYFNPREVNGVGSLMHSFKTPIPVSFITPNGVVPAKLISIKFKIIGQGMGCISDQPQIIFSCSQIVDQNDILGVYISVLPTSVNPGVIKRQSRVWTADLNADGIADLVGLQGNSLGEASGSTLAETIWYANIDGEWLIVDWAAELDCT
jgi:hypothetical protein